MPAREAKPTGAWRAVSVWRETPFFTERERAALEWTAAVTLVSQTDVPDDVWNM